MEEASLNKVEVSDASAQSLSKEIKAGRGFAAEPDGCRVLFGKVCAGGTTVRIVAGVTIVLVFILLVMFRSSRETDASITSSLHRVIRVNSSAELIAELKVHNLWDIKPEARIPAVLFIGYPENLRYIEVPLKKRAFLHALLPAALVALEEVNRERATLLAIMDKAGGLPHLGPDSFSGLHDLLAVGEVDFLRGLAAKYRSGDPDELLRRIDLVPVSLILAQGALESSWGSSRFANAGNNIFGVWTWGEKGIIPARREEGKRHKMAIYDSILSSVRAYILNLNRLPAYEKFRKIRQQGMDPYSLAGGLLYYSARGEDYISDVRRIIEYNNLELYDHCVLAGGRQSAEDVPTA